MKSGGQISVAELCDTPEYRFRENLPDHRCRRTIYQEDAAGLRMCVPPLPEQHEIVQFIQRETSRIDALIAAKERVLGLLAEKRRALITRAVTRGLDPHAPLRDSGIPWLGEIPAHWEVRKI